MQYKEYLNEIPYNTVKTWGEWVQKHTPWEFVGWSGEPREPYRHWAAYPPFADEYKKIWDGIKPTLEEDGLFLKPERLVANLFNHGDSCWLHRDCDSPTDWTVIIYLNAVWDINWGGGTILVENNEVTKYFAATPGKIVAFKSNALHGPVPVSREAPFPRLGLTFQCAVDDSNLQRLSKTEFSSLSTTKL